jgi:addiction module RelE/StbE family toxin
MRIIWSPFAIERIIEIAKYITNDNPVAAEKWVNSVFNAVKRLEDFPESGRMVPEIQKREFREIISGNYRIVYRLYNKEIRILTIRHGKQILPPEDFREK